MRPSTGAAELAIPPLACSLVLTRSSGHVTILLTRPAPAPAMRDSLPCRTVHLFLSSRSDSKPKEGVRVASELRVILIKNVDCVCTPHRAMADGKTSQRISERRPTQAARIQPDFKAEGVRERRHRCAVCSTCSSWPATCSLSVVACAPERKKRL